MKLCRFMEMMTARNLPSTNGPNDLKDFKEKIERERRKKERRPTPEINRKKAAAWWKTTDELRSK